MELLAELQHYGAATGLIDFTSSALIALWFACQEETGKAGKVVAMATDDIRAFSTTSYEDLKKPVKEFLNQGKLWKWEPSGQNNRIVAQQSVFVFGEGRIEKSRYEEITIAAVNKKIIIETLKKSFGIRGQQLFNDLAGFAHINAHNQPYSKFIAEDFLLFGQLFHQRGEYPQAIERYDRTLEIDSELAMAYYYRGLAKSALGDHLGAIADNDMAISLNPQNGAAYYNRGLAKSALGDYQGTIADYNTAISLNPQNGAAYYNRGLAKSTLGDYQGTIADYNMTIGLNPQDSAAYYNRGLAKSALGDYLGAIADYDVAISLNPQDSAAYYNRGISKRAIGDEAGAIQDFGMASELNPNLRPPQ